MNWTPVRIHTESPSHNHTQHPASDQLTARIHGVHGRICCGCRAARWAPRGRAIGLCRVGSAGMLSARSLCSLLLRVPPPSVLAPHSHHLHPTTAPSTGQFLGGPNNQPIYFAGTDPRQPGFPPPEDENDVGTPRDQWELAYGPLDLYDLLGPNHF